MFARLVENAEEEGSITSIPGPDPAVALSLALVLGGLFPVRAPVIAGVGLSWSNRRNRCCELSLDFHRHLAAQRGGLREREDHVCVIEQGGFAAEIVQHVCALQLLGGWSYSAGGRSRLIAGAPSP